MKTRIGDYKIEGDKKTWTLTKINIGDGFNAVGKPCGNKGKEISGEQNFFAKLYHLLIFLLDKNLSDADAISVKELKDLINKHAIDIKELAIDIKRT